MIFEIILNLFALYSYLIFFVSVLKKQLIPPEV